MKSPVMAQINRTKMSNAVPMTDTGACATRGRRSWGFADIERRIGGNFHGHAQSPVTSSTPSALTSSNPWQVALVAASLGGFATPCGRRRFHAVDIRFMNASLTVSAMVASHPSISKVTRNDSIRPATQATSILFTAPF